MVQDVEQAPGHVSNDPPGNPVNRSLFNSPSGSAQVLGGGSPAEPMAPNNSPCSAVVPASAIPRFFASQSLLDMVRRSQGRDVDVHIFGDGRRDETLPPGVRVYEVRDHPTLNPSCLQGHHSLFLFPRFIPFQDALPQYCLRSWCALIGNALQSADGSTLVTVVLEARFHTPHLPSLPMLDRRFELDKLRKFLVKVVVMPDVILNERCPESQRVVACRQPPQHPLLLFAYRGGASFATIPPHDVWYVPRPMGEMDLVPPEDARAFHVLCNYETPEEPEIHHPVTALRFLMAMNALSPDETSTQFKLATTLKFPASILPIVQRASPDGVSIAHMYIGADWIGRMEEERESLHDLGFSWCILGDGNDRVLLNHLPRRRGGGPGGRKHPSPQVRDAILSAPHVAALFQELILFSRWDVLGLLKDGVTHSRVACVLEQLDDIVVQDSSQFLRVWGRDSGKHVEPPELIVHFPPALLQDYVISVLARVVPLQNVSPLALPGQALVCVENLQAAPFLYGCVIPCVGCGPILLTSGSAAKDAEWENSVGLPARATVQDRQLAIAQIAQPAAPRLTGANLLGLAGSPPGNGESPEMGL